MQHLHRIEKQGHHGGICVLRLLCICIVEKVEREEKVIGVSFFSMQCHDQYDITVEGFCCNYPVGDISPTIYYILNTRNQLYK